MSTESNPIQALSEAFTALQEQNAMLEEGMADIRAQFAYEDMSGWRLISGVASGDQVEGLDLDEVHAIAEKISPRIVAGALPRRAVDLHSGFVFGRGMYIEGTEKPRGRGAIPKIRRVFADMTNQESVFSDIAKEELQKERFVSGNVLVAVNTKTGKINRIPFKQIKDVKVDPDFPENVIAWMREWDTQDGSTNSVKRRWYYTKRFTGTRQRSYTKNGETILVEPNTTVVDLRAGRQVGHILGIPDGVAGIHWAELYSRAVKSGLAVAEGMAKIIFRVTNKTKQGVQSTGVKIANSDVTAGTASMAEGQELTAISTAGRGYDFASLRDLAGMAALAWNVSVMDLLNSAAASGASYGSASALVPGNRNAMLLMQKEWADFYKDIFDVLGEGRPTVVFEPFEAPDKYRELQAITLGSVALSDEEYRMSVLAALDIVGDSSDVPDALKLRNEPQQTAVQQASPDQGRSSGTGTGNGDSGGQGANDQRSDGIGESLRREMAMEDQLTRMSEMLARFEELTER